MKERRRERETRRRREGEGGRSVATSQAVFSVSPGLEYRVGCRLWRKKAGVEGDKQRRVREEVREEEVHATNIVLFTSDPNSRGSFQVSSSAKASQTPSSSPTASSSTAPFSSTNSGLSPALLAPLALLNVPCSATFALPPMLPRLIKPPLLDPGELDGVGPFSKSARRSSSSSAAGPRKELETREGGGGEGGTEKGRFRNTGEV